MNNKSSPGFLYYDLDCSSDYVPLDETPNTSTDTSNTTNKSFYTPDKKSNNRYSPRKQSQPQYFNKSWNRNQSYAQNRGYRNNMNDGHFKSFSSPNNSGNNRTNYSNYLHDSFLEDPWKDLYDKVESFKKETSENQVELHNVT